MNTRILSLILAAAGACLAAPLAAQELPAASAAMSPQPWRDSLRAVYEELIEINTTHDHGSTTDAANAVARRLIAAGYPQSDVHVAGPSETKGNLVARLRGSNPALKPVLLLAHLDVVEALRSDWSFDPFTLKDSLGYFYGRGTGDDKAMAAIFATNMIRMKREGIVPERDIILALTADEEGGDENGVDWLLQNRRDWVDAGFGINEGGGGQIEHGRRILNAVQASEKVFQTFTLEVTNPGGHSSRPTRNNAIYHLADALSRLETYEFPVKLNEVTRTYFQRMGQIQQGQAGADMRAVAADPANAEVVARLSESPFYNALLRTTCIPTMLAGGHAENALPQLARATVNCRILPGESPDSVQARLVRVVADDQVKITPLAPPKPSDPSPLTAEIMGPIERITQAMFPGVPVVPTMSTGATDGLYFRNAGIPIYGVSGIFTDVNDARAHGRDERIPKQSLFEGQEFLWRLVREVAG